MSAALPEVVGYNIANWGAVNTDFDMWYGVSCMYLAYINNY